MELIQEMESEKVDICVLCETRTQPKEMQQTNVRRSGQTYIATLGVNLHAASELGNWKCPW